MDRLIVIADDLTGANDVASQFSRQGIRVLVFPDWRMEMQENTRVYPVVVVNTESRHIPPEEAAERVGRVVEQAKKQQISYFYKKTDSTLRGNIGAELEALREKTEGKQLMFVPANPGMGQQVIDGILYVKGFPLAQSAFAHDPHHPMRESEVIRILRSQVDTPCYLVQNNREKIANPGFYLFDSKNEEELKELGAWLQQKDLLRAVAGSAGLARILPEILSFPKKQKKEKIRSQRRLIVNGSLNPVSHKQVEWSARQKIPHKEEPII